MRFLSIRAKVTLWYTLFMIVLVAVMLGVLVKYSGAVMLANQKEQLVRVVEETAKKLREDSEEEDEDEDEDDTKYEVNDTKKLEEIDEDDTEGIEKEDHDNTEDIEKDEFDYFEDGVYLLQYNGKKEYLGGSAPSKALISFTLEDGVVQTVEENNHIFYIYDRKIHNENGKTFWLRGIVSNVETNQLNKTIIGSTFVLLPLLVVLSSTIGYLITKRAFNPVRKIQETTQKITESKELGMRIGLPLGKDEISKLGQTIDLMLEQLERSFEKEKQFTSDASHELRTPISVILTESEYMLQHVETVDEARESMEVVNRQANRMSELINQLLFFTRAEEGSIQLQYELVDINKLIYEIIEDNRMLAKQHTITITMIQKEQAELPCFVDRMLFIRAVQNVIQNGIVYGKPNGHVQVKVFKVPDYFVVEVKDDGIGISKTNLDKIWNRFYQVDEARSRQNAGSSGLGLSMVKWITNKHGGYAKVESTLNVGSRFSLYFPLKKGE